MIKLMIDDLGFQHTGGKDLARILIRSTGTTGNIIKDHESIYHFSVLIENGEITEFRGLGGNYEFNLFSRKAFGIQSMKMGYYGATEEFIEELWPGLIAEILKSAEECKVFEKIKYSGN